MLLAYSQFREKDIMLWTDPQFLTYLILQDRFKIMTTLETESFFNSKRNKRDLEKKKKTIAAIRRYQEGIKCIKGIQPQVRVEEKELL